MVRGKKSFFSLATCGYNYLFLGAAGAGTNPTFPGAAGAGTNAGVGATTVGALPPTTGAEDEEEPLPPRCSKETVPPKE